MARLACSAASLAWRIDSACSSVFSMRFCSVMSLLMPRSHSWESSTILVTSRNSQTWGSPVRVRIRNSKRGKASPLHRLLMKTQSGFKVVGVNQRVEPAADPIGARPARDRLERRAQGDHDSLAVEFPEDDTGGLDQAVVPSLRLLEGLEGPLAVADIAGHDQSDRLGLGVNPAHTDVDRQGRACCPAQIIPLARVKEPRSIQCQGEPVEIAGSAAEEEVAQAHRAG